jgi:hypothetical protein
MPGDRHTGQEATEPGHVLVVLGEKEAQEFKRRHEAPEPSAFVDHRERILAPLDRLPGHGLAALAGHDPWRLTIHERGGYRFGRSSDDHVDRHEADQPFVLDDGDRGNGVERGAAKQRPHLAGGRAGRDDWDTPGDMLLSLPQRCERLAAAGTSSLGLKHNLLLSIPSIGCACMRVNTLERLFLRSPGSRRADSRGREHVCAAEDR